MIRLARWDLFKRGKEILESLKRLKRAFKRALGEIAIARKALTKLQDSFQRASRKTLPESIKKNPQTFFFFFEGFPYVITLMHIKIGNK